MTPATGHPWQTVRSRHHSSAWVLLLCLLGLDASVIPLSAQTASSPDRQSACDRSKFPVVIDVGHTPQAQGATSARGMSEFSFNLNLAHVVGTMLIKAGFMATHVMETSGVGSAQLFARAARANALVPGLFLSLHHDSVQPRFFSAWIHEGRSLAYSDKFSGYSIFVATNTAFAKPSLAFATLLSDALLTAGMTYSLHHAARIEGENRALLDASRGIYSYDGLIVLKATHAPAALLEAGVIVNRDEERLLSSPAYQARIAEAITTAVTSFCVLRQSGG